MRDAKDVVEPRMTFCTRTGSQDARYGLSIPSKGLTTMAESEKAKQPVQQHRSSSDMGDDDPRQAAESGEQGETSRSHGRIIDESGEPSGDAPQKGKAGKGEHWESGRHTAE